MRNYRILFLGAALAALSTITSCTGLQKIGAALSSPNARQIELSLTKAGLLGAVAAGKLSPGDAVTIAKGVGVLTSAEDGTTKIVQLEKIGLDTAISKGLVKPGDVVQITEASAVITPAPAPISPSNVVIPTVVPIEADK